MFRQISVIVVVAAVLMTPVIASAAMGGRGGGAHLGGGGTRSLTGSGSSAGVRNFAGPRTYGAGVVPGHRFDHRHFRRGTFFVGASGPDGSFSDDPSCWRGRPTALSFPRVYVCDEGWGN
jgi:hypothetical protein